MNISQGDAATINALSSAQHFRYEIDVKTSRDITYDISCFALDAQNRLVDTKDFVFYNQKSSPCRSIEMVQDEEDALYFKIKSKSLPSYVSKLVFVLTCDDPANLVYLNSISINCVDAGRRLDMGDVIYTHARSSYGSLLVSVLHVEPMLEHRMLGISTPKGLSDVLDGFTHGNFGHQEPLKPADRQVSQQDDLSELSSAADLTQKTSELTEQDLYPKLIEFISTNLEIYGMRIDEKTSSNKKGKGGNQWLHPDVVALETVDQGWDTLIRNCVRLSGGQSARLWSFEVKKELTGSNARMAFFQAVSNSSWANEGYLVACSIHHSVEEELKMLSGLHGIGVILLDPHNPDNSTIWLQADRRERVDWQTANRIASTNRDYKRYIDLVSTYYETGRLRESDWGN